MKALRLLASNSHKLKLVAFSSKIGDYTLEVSDDNQVVQVIGIRKNSGDIMKAKVWGPLPGESEITLTYAEEIEDVGGN